MKPLIVNLRGNSGSGKTHTTREFFKKCKLFRAINDGKDCEMVFGKQSWVVLGKYTNVCGGVDTIKTQQEIIDRVKFYTDRKYNVWCEGLIMSTIYGTVGAYSEQFKDRWIFAILQPPLEILLSRIKVRRKEAGNFKPLNEENTRKRVATIARNVEILKEHNRRVVILNWNSPLSELLKIIKKEG